MVNVILRAKCARDEYDDLILYFREENEQDVVDNIKNFIEDLKFNTNGQYTTDDIFEKIGEVYNFGVINPQKLKIIEY